MSNNTYIITKISNKIEIPYYNKQFLSLMDVLNKQIDKYNDGEFDLSKYVELKTIVQGIKYYYEVIINETAWDEDRRKKMCNKLIKSANRSIFAFLSEHNNSDNKNKNIHVENNKYMIAYKEYLQKVSNLFCKKQTGSDIPKLIFSFSMDLMGETVKMDQPFSIICGSEVPEVEYSLCAVFSCLNKNMEINNAFTYLPMLTHEVSHNFRYIPRDKRNRDVLDFLLNSVSNMIIRQLFAQVSDNHHDILLKKVVDVLSEPIKDVILEGINAVAPEYMNEGKLDILPSIINSILNSSTENNESLDNYYHKGVSEYDIIKSSFMGLSKLSDFEWYFPIKDNEYDKVDGAITASILMDIFSGEKIDDVKAVYTNIVFKDSDSVSQIEKILNNKFGDDFCISNDQINIAANEIILSVMSKIKKDFVKYYKTDKQKDNLNNLVLSLAMNIDRFQEQLELFINSSSAENIHISYDLIDRCIQAKSFIDNIFFICRSNKNGVVKKDKLYNTIKRIYEKLHDKVQDVLKDDAVKPYFCSRSIHSSCIKLGLFNEKENPDIFISHYLQMFKEWDKDRFFALVNEYLSLYREVFADLTMCAVFQFDQLGYFKFMANQFGYEYDTQQWLSGTMTLERVHTVMRVLEGKMKEEKKTAQIKEKIKNYDFSKLNISEFWSEIKTTYLSENRKDNFDNIYSSVYYENILPSEWIKELQNDITIQKIQRYYNDDIIPEDGMSAANKLFFDSYCESSEKRKKICESGELDPFEATLGEL